MYVQICSQIILINSCQEQRKLAAQRRALMKACEGQIDVLKIKIECKCRFYMYFSPSSVAVKKSKRRLKKVSIKVNSVKVLRT